MNSRMDLKRVAATKTIHDEKVKPAEEFIHLLTLTSAEFLQFWRTLDPSELSLT